MFEALRMADEQVHALRRQLRACEVERTFELRSTRALGQVTLEALDHHRKVYASKSAAVGTGWTRFTVPYTIPTKPADGEGGADQIDGLRIRAGGAILELPRPHQVWTDNTPLDIHSTFGGMKSQ